MSNPRLEQLLNMYSESPEDSFLVFALAKEYEGMAMQQQALEYYLLLMKNDPDYVGTYYHLGKLYERMEEPEWAVAIYDKGMEVAKAQQDRHALNELAGARMELSDE